MNDSTYKSLGNMINAAIFVVAFWMMTEGHPVGVMMAFVLIWLVLNDYES